MNTKPQIPGIHHITAITSSAQDNLLFYQDVLGLRLVKKTVNFDDPFTYHFYYGDAHGSPGTILTFFPWENMPKGRPGAGMITAISFAIDQRSTDYWIERLARAGCTTQTVERFGQKVIQFTDLHGLPLELTAMAFLPPTAYWHTGPVEERHTLTGFHSASATLNSLDQTQRLLTDVMGMTFYGREGNRYRFKMRDTGPGNFLDVVFDPGARAGRQGGGTVHHIAFRADNDIDQLGWQSILRSTGTAVTEVRDRNYFHSIYYYSPGGVLFEIATDPPGFALDESFDRLGCALMLPPQYKSMRAEIEQHLPQLPEENSHCEAAAATA